MNTKKFIHDTKVAMLFGMILGDGWLSQSDYKYKDRTYKIYHLGISGDIEDLKTMIADARSIWGNIGKATIYTKRTHSPKYKIEGVTNHFTMNKKVSTTFCSLGMPVGKRVRLDFSLPNWIVYADNIEIKKAFISGLYAAEGDNLLFQKNDKTLKAPSFVLSKHFEYKDSFYKLCKQISDILIAIGIKHSLTYTVKYTSEKSLFSRFTIHNSMNNILQFLQNVDMRYCKRKELRFHAILQYYLDRKRESDIAKKVYKYTIQHPEVRVSEIAKKYQYTWSRVDGWRKGRRNPGITKSTKTFTSFINTYSPIKNPLNGENLQ